MSDFLHFGAQKCKNTPFCTFGPITALLDPWLLPLPRGEGDRGAAAGDDRRLGEDGEGGGGIGWGSQRFPRGGALASTEWIWCQRAPRPEVVPLHSYPRRGLTGFMYSFGYILSTFGQGIKA